MPREANAAAAEIAKAPSGAMPLPGWALHSVRGRVARVLTDRCHLMDDNGPGRPARAHVRYDRSGSFMLSTISKSFSFLFIFLFRQVIGNFQVEKD